jgi:hypothetical protein
MDYLVYMSTAKWQMEEEELVDILIAAREKNKTNNITGMLLYSDRIFIQLLEGAKKDIDKIYDTIALDTRHKNVISLLTGNTAQRNFPDWRMGFASVNAETLKEFRGFINPALPGFLGNDNDMSIKMLKIFVDANHLTD